MMEIVVLGKILNSFKVCDNFIRKQCSTSEENCLSMINCYCNFERRPNSSYSDVEYFMTRYSQVIGQNLELLDQVFHEFVEYQLLRKEDIPETVWMTAKAGGEGETFVCMDVVWNYLRTKKTPDGCHLQFSNLSRIALLVLAIPHSNAQEERVFSLIKLNKTPQRSNLDLEQTLSSIITIKMQEVEPCYNFEPTSDMLKQAKKATWEYNKEHTK